MQCLGQVRAAHRGKLYGAQSVGAGLMKPSDNYIHAYKNCMQEKEVKELAQVLDRNNVTTSFSLVGSEKLLPARTEEAQGSQEANGTANFTSQEVANVREGAAAATCGTDDVNKGEDIYEEHRALA